MTRLALLSSFGLCTLVGTSLSAGAAELETNTLQPIREAPRSELSYRPIFGGVQSRFDRLTLHAELNVPITRRGLSVSLHAGYDYDVLGLSGAGRYGDTLSLHRLEFGPYLAFPLGSGASLSLDALAVVSGDLSQSRKENWQVEARLTYNRATSSARAFNVGIEVSRLFGPLVPYPTVSLYLGDQLTPFRVRGALPRDVEAYIALGERARLGLLTTFEGRYWWVTGTGSPHSILIQELRVGARFFARPLDWLGLDVRAGTVAIRRTNISDGLGSAPNTVQGPGFFAGISLPVLL